MPAPEEHGRIVISCASNNPPGRLKGQDLNLFLVDADGTQHRLPAKSIVIRCDGRKEEVITEVELMVSKMDLDLMATFVREDIDLD